MNNINQKLIDDLNESIRFLQYFNRILRNDTAVGLEKSNVTFENINNQIP